MEQDKEIVEYILTNFKSNLNWKEKVRDPRILLWCSVDFELICRHEIASGFLKLFEDMLYNRPSTLSKEDIRLIEELYFITLNTGLITEYHLVEMYKLDPKIECKPIIFPRFYKSSNFSTLPKLLENSKIEIFKFATSSILAIQNIYFNNQKRIMLSWQMGEKYWTNAKQDKSEWSPIYIRAMSNCLLKWSKHYDEWLEAIKEANTGNLKEAWADVILESGCEDDQDRMVLLKIVINLLELSNKLDCSLDNIILSSSIKRLEKIVLEMVPKEIDEDALHLPLAKRSCSHPATIVNHCT